MTFLQVIGRLMVSIPFLIFFIWVIRSLGWKYAIFLAFIWLYVHVALSLITGNP